MKEENYVLKNEMKEEKCFQIPLHLLREDNKLFIYLDNN